jgi:hypothetical protein
VLDVGQGAELVLEPVQILGHRRLHRLERHQRVRLGVEGLVDGPGSPLPENAANLVAT